MCTDVMTKGRYESMQASRPRLRWLIRSAAYSSRVRIASPANDLKLRARGVRAAAVYRLTETAKLNRLDPEAHRLICTLC